MTEYNTADSALALKVKKRSLKINSLDIPRKQVIQDSSRFVK